MLSVCRGSRATVPCPELGDPTACEGFSSVKETCQKNSTNTDELHFCYKGGHSFWPYEPCAQIFLWLRAMRHSPQRAEREGTSRRVSEAGNSNCSPGPCCHSPARVVCSDCSPSAPPQWQFHLLACGCQGCASPRPACAIALLLPGWPTVGEPHSQCLQALSHCCSTRTKTENKWTKGKLWLLSWPQLLSHAVFVSLSHLSISYCV